MNRKVVNIYSLVSGFITLFLAFLVMFGWHTGNKALVQINPAFAPMQYNTALGFLLCALGLIALSLKYRKLAGLFGGGAFLLGGTTLCQYIFHIDFGVDKLFVEPVFLTKTSHPGRMAPITALCFTLSGFALTSMIGLKKPLIVSASLAILILAFLSFAGYIIHDEGLYGWGNLTRMAIHTALGFAIVGSSLSVYSLWGWSGKKFDFWELAPFSIAVVVAVLTFFAWYMIEEEGRARNEAYTNGLINDTQAVLSDRYHLYEEALRGGVGLYYASKSVERAEWRKYVKALEIEQNLPGINGIGYIDYVFAQDLDEYLKKSRADGAPDFKNHPETFYPDKFVIKFIEPVQTNIEAIGLDIGFEANRRAAAERARDLGIPALTKKILLVQDHQKQAGFLLLLPVYETRETPATIEDRRKHFQGWVYAPFIGPNFFKDIGSINKNQLYLEVFDGKKKIETALIYRDPEYNHDAYHESENGQDTLTTKMNIAGRTWTMEWHINENFRPPANQNLRLFLLVFGWAFSLFLYFTLNRLLRSKEVIRRKVDKRTKELRESESRRRAVLNTTVDAVLTINEKGEIQSFNPAAEHMFGYKFEDVIQQNVSMLMPEPYRSGHDGYLENFMRTGEKKILGTTREIEGRRKDGSVFPIALSVSEVELDDEKLFSGIIRDITEAKEAQDKILAANEELERSNHELERFAYIASHDLQEPLRKIGGFTERLETHLANHIRGDEKAEQYMHFVTSGVVRMRELILGLLEYSRVTTTEIDIRKLNANEIVAYAVDALSHTIEDSGAQVIYEDLPDVYYDKVMLTQLFQNLIGNAIKYRSEEAPEVLIKARKTNNFWEFSVQDNGMGMEEKHLERIFEMFQRLHRKEDISGTGIGLSLCRKIVERYGGEIWVTSKPGRGSIFFFTIPVIESLRR